MKFKISMRRGRKEIASATVFADDWKGAMRQLDSVLYTMECRETQQTAVSRITSMEVRLGPE